MYPGLSHDEIIEECLKELKHHFEVGPEVALISAEKGVQCVPFDESLQKKFPYFEGTYEVFDVPHADPKNALDIEKYLSHKEKIRPDDQFVLMDVDSLPPA